MLGSAQRRVLGVLRELGEATVREIHTVLRERGDDVAYTTVSTVLNRLHERDLVEKTEEEYKGKPRHVYAYKDIERDYLDTLLSAVYTTLGAEGVMRLRERIEDVSDEELERIRDRLGE